MFSPSNRTGQYYYTRVYLYVNFVYFFILRQFFSFLCDPIAQLLNLCEVFAVLSPMPVKRRGMFAVRVPRNDVAVGCLAVPEYSPLAGLKVGADVVEGGHLGNVSDEYHDECIAQMLLYGRLTFDITGRLYHKGLHL